MLAEFNSEQAIGSAMKESEKSANNWSGSINKLKNSWTELVNEFVKSEEVITVVQKLTKGIENLSSSDTIKGLKSLTDTIIDLGEAVSATTDYFEKKFPTISKYVGKGLKQGLNSARGFGFISGLSKVRELLDKQEDSAKEAAKTSEKLRRTYLENASTMDEESTSIRSITSEYASLVVGLEDTTDVKGKLMELQNKVIDQYGQEAGGIDLVNKSLEENIKLLTEKAQKENEDFLTHNASGIDEAKRIFGIDDLNGKTKSGSSFMDFQITKSMLDTNKYGSSDHYDEVRTEANIIFQTVKNIIAEEYSDVFDNIDFTGEVQGEKFGEAYLNDFVIGFKEGLTAEQQTKAAQALTEALAKTFNMKGKNISYFDMESLIEDAQESAAIFSQANDIIVDALRRTSDKEVWDAFEKDTETYNKYLDLIKQVGKYQSELNKEDSTYADRVIASRGLQVSLLELQRIAEQYPVVADTMSSSLNEMGISFEDATRSVESAQESWKKSLDEAQQGVLSDIDKIKSAMQSLAEGKKLSSKDFWEIAGLDTDNVLSDIKVVNGEFTVGAESLMKLKDSIIRQEIENYGHQIDQIRTEHKNTLEEIEASAQEVANLEREINEKNIDLTQTVFGNIDTDSRQALEWTNNNLLKYEDAIESWGSSIEDLAGSVSTVFGAYEEFDGVDIAFSPILQTENGAVMLSKSTVDRYIQQLIDNAGEGWTTELLLELDTKGLEIDGYKVKNLIADIGDTAAKTSQQMHYVGATGALARAKTAYDEINESAKGFLGTLKNTVLMQKYLISMLGNTVDVQKALEAQKKTLEDEVAALKKEAEGRLNAQLHVIDQEIDKHEKEVDLLEKEKDALNDQLEALEKQKEELDKIVDNYDTVASFVQSTIEKQIEEIEDNRSKVEDYYDSLINKLKEENDERQAAIDKEEKLNALNNAKKNKVRYYDGARGWTYGVDQEALKKAQKDLDAFEADEKINALEKEKDSKLKPYDDQIKQLEEYAESWGKATDFIVEESNELLAEQILGANWREKIESKDENLLKSFQTQYRNYNTQLDILTNKEIESLKKSISAKDDEIKAKQEQVTWWKNYKDSIQSATKGVEDYVQYLNTVDLSNPEKNLTDFTTTYKKFVTEISSKEADIIRITNELNNLGSAYSGIGGNGMAAGMGSTLGIMSGLTANLRAATASLSTASSTTTNREKTLDEIKDLVDQIEKNQEKVYPELHVPQKGEKIKPVTAYASGGVNTNTGMAWLDGTVTRPELILNNTDVSKLYNWIHTMSSSQAILQSKSNGIAKTSNAAIFNISNMEINGVQNPIEFAKQFEQNINRYWNTKLTESKVY